MKPTKKSNGSDSQCSAIIGTNCIKWSGGTFVCLEDISTGDSLTNILLALEEKICSVESKLDLESLDFDCIDYDGVEPYTTLSVLQTLIVEHCNLKAIVDALGGEEVEGCDGTWSGDACVNFWEIAEIDPIPGSPTVDEMITYITTATCNLKTLIDELEGRIEDLEEAGGGGGGGSYTPPTVDSNCDLYPDNSDMDDAIEAIDADLCELKDVVGVYSELEGALNPPSIEGESGASIITACLDDLESELGSSETLSETTAQMWEVITRLTKKVCELEESHYACCKFSCKTFEIELVPSLTEDRTEIKVFILYNGSTTKPSDISACDDEFTLTFTDVNGTKRNVSVNIDDLAYGDEEDLYTFPLAGSGLDINSGDITVSANICIKHTSVTDEVTTCFKCVEATLNTANYCEWCTFQVIQTGDNVDVSIEYNLEGGGAVGNLIITAEGHYKIPYGVVKPVTVVDSSTGGAVLLHSENCPDLFA